MNKRGIGPLISIVLLIGFVIIIAAIIFFWGENFTKSISEETGEGITTNLKCSILDYDITKVTCDDNENIKSVTISIKSDIEIVGTRLRVIDKNGITITAPEDFTIIRSFSKKTILWDGISTKPVRIETIPTINVQGIGRHVCSNVVEVFNIDEILGCNIQIPELPEPVPDPEPEIDCMLTSAVWLDEFNNPITAPIEENKLIRLSVESNEECNGKVIDLLVEEKDPASTLAANIQPESSIISNRIAKSTWITEYDEDINIHPILDPDIEPEYFFTATVKDTNEKQVSGLVEIFKTLEQPQQVCGNNIIEAPEVCDGTTFSGSSLCINHNTIYSSGTLQCIDCMIDISDCKVAPFCGNGICEPPEETCFNCRADCLDICPRCTDKDGDLYAEEQAIGCNTRCSIDKPCDGYFDCNDHDPEINPGKDEICDGKDNDCDNEIDEGRVCQTFN